MFDNETLTYNDLNKEPECDILKLIGAYCAFLFCVSISLNLTVVWVLIKNRKELLIHVNILTLVLVILNILGTLTGLPIVAVTSFSCK